MSTPTIKNRKARYEFDVEETYEAGLVLRGTEVKSLRQGKASLKESFAYMKDGEVWLRDMYIKPYEHASYANHNDRRERKLLLNKREIREIDQSINQQGYTLVPLKLYFKKGYAKVLMGLAKGKKRHDKRQDIKERDQKRELERQYKGTYKIDM
jgi:SsrA-binding protein